MVFRKLGMPTIMAVSIVLLLGVAACDQGSPSRQPTAQLPTATDVSVPPSAPPPNVVPVLTEAPASTETISPSPTVVPVPTAAPVPAPTVSSPTVVPVPTAAPVPAPTVSPSPTVVPVPTAAPAPTPAVSPDETVVVEVAITSNDYRTEWRFSYPELPNARILLSDVYVPADANVRLVLNAFDRDTHSINAGELFEEYTWSHPSQGIVDFRTPNEE